LGRVRHHWELEREKKVITATRDCDHYTTDACCWIWWAYFGLQHGEKRYIAKVGQYRGFAGRMFRRGEA